MLLNFNHNTKNTIHPSQSDMNGDYIKINTFILLILSYCLCCVQASSGMCYWTQHSTLNCCIIACILTKKLNVGSALKDLSKFCLLGIVALLPVGFIFFENNASKDKRSVIEYWLICIKFCHHKGKGGQIPLMSTVFSEWLKSHFKHVSVKCNEH